MRVLLLIIILLTGCQAETESSVIRFGLQSAPIHLDPRRATDASAERINRLIFQSLVDVDDQLRAVPGLATWQVISPTHYRFTLKADNDNFHNGKKLTTKDILACYEYILNVKNASPHQGNLAHIKNMKVIDDKTIDFYLSRDDALFPGRLSIGIPDAQSVGVGNGPFKISSANTMSDVLLQRVYDGQTVSFVHVKDPSVRVLKLLRGELDIIQNDLPAELIAYLQKQDSVDVQSGRGSTFSYIGFNMDDPLTSQWAIRKAISLAIDRNQLINTLLGGRATLSHSVLPLQHWARNKKMPTFSYQPAKAIGILKKAGYSNSRRPHITYKTTTNPLRLRIATVIQKQLADVGINMEIRSYDWGTFYADIKSGNFQMYSLSWVGISSPDIYQTVFHSQSVPPKGANRGRYKNAQVDQLLDGAFSTSNNPEALISRIDSVQGILLEDLPYIPLWFENNIAVTSKRIHGYSLSLNGNYDALAKVTLVPQANGEH